MTSVFLGIGVETLQTQYAVRIHPHLCHRLSDFLCLVRVPESRVNRGSVFLGGGEVYSAGRCKEGSGLQKPGLFGQWCSVLDNQTADQGILGKLDVYCSNAKCNTSWYKKTKC